MRSGAWPRSQVFGEVGHRILAVVTVTSALGPLSDGRPFAAVFHPVELHLDERAATDFAAAME